MWSKIGLLALLALTCVVSPAWAQNTNKADYQEQFLQNAAVATGNGTPMAVDRYTSVGVDVSLAGTATITFEGSVEGTTAYSVLCVNTATGGSSTTASASGTYQCNIAGLKGFRARISSWTSGAVTVYARATTAILGTTSGGSGASVATAAAPTLVEGAPATFSFDLADNLRMTMGTLLSGEIQSCGSGDTVGCLAVSGAPVRYTTMASSVTTNTTSAAVALPLGTKTIYGSVDGTGSVTQTQAIYGGLTSGVTTTNGTLLCTFILSATTHSHDQCTSVGGPWLFYIIVTTNTTGTGATGAVTAMY